MPPIAWHYARPFICILSFILTIILRDGTIISISQRGSCDLESECRELLKANAWT